MFFNGRPQPKSSPPPATGPWTPSRRPAGPPSESDNTPGGASRRSSTATTILFTGRQRSARQSSGGGFSSSNAQSRATSPRSSAPDWRSTASPENAGAFAISPTATPPVPTAAFKPPHRSLSAAAINLNNYSHNNATATTTTGSPAPSQSYFGQPQPHLDSASPSLDAITATGTVPNPQVSLTATEASYLVCPWWWTYSRCGQRGCNFSHTVGPKLKQQPLMCPYWLRSPGTTGAGCNKAEGSCQFAHYHCEHGQKAPVPKPK